MSKPNPTQDFYIRRARTEDGSQIARVFHDAKQAFYYSLSHPEETDDAIRSRVWSPNRSGFVVDSSSQTSFVLVAEGEIGEIGGFIVVKVAPERARVSELNIEPVHWRKRIGTGLLQATVFVCASLGIPEIDLGVHVKNWRAIALYEKTGFAVVAESESRLTMGRSLV